MVPAAKVLKVIDTTAAGDAFNAAYIAGRRGGLQPLAAAEVANRIAAIVIQHSGAILPREKAADLQSAFAIR